MSDEKTADEIFPLVTSLAPNELGRLLRMILAVSPEYETLLYAAKPVPCDEFSSDEDPLSWDGEGWEGFN